MRCAAILLLPLGIALGVLPGCKTARPGVDPDVPLPSYQEIARVHNARVEQMGRLWARTIVSLRYEDEDGNKRYEQGDGHIQRLDFDSIALDVGKLGELIFWFGADENLYWVFDLSSPDHTVAFVGHHAFITLDKAARASLPIPPLEYMTLAGLAPLPSKAPASTISVTESGQIQLEVLARGFPWRYTLDPSTFLPSRIAILDERGDRAVIVSELSEYRTVDLTGVGIDQPRAPGRIAISHLPTQTSITLTIDGDIIDGRRAGKPKPAAFDFNHLVRALSPDEVIDLDVPERAGPEGTP